ncbi:MAG: ATP-binding protein [Acutalibacteraceae bacterium]|nr:ATP-binding protein [Acutalibacteraceae bacterium]
MGLSREIYEKAIKIKNDTIKKAQQNYEADLAKLREDDPEFREIETALAKAGSSIAITAMSGDTAALGRLQEFCTEKNARKKEIMAKAGIIKPEVFCTACGDSGYKNGKLCDCITDIAKKLAYEDMSRSLPLSQSGLDSFCLDYYPDCADEGGTNPRKRAAAILKLCRRFVEDFPDDCRSLLFMGGAGLGKTHLSLAIVSEISAKGYGVVYGSAQNLFSRAEKEHFSFSGETTAQDSLLNCDLLVIDDLGTEFYSSFTSSLFYNIINSRMLSGKPTVINTNLSFDELEKRYTARITSRFIGSYDMRIFVGQDIRQIKAMK